MEDSVLFQSLLLWPLQLLISSRLSSRYYNIHMYVIIFYLFFFYVSDVLLKRNEFLQRFYWLAQLAIVSCQQLVLLFIATSSVANTESETDYQFFLLLIVPLQVYFCVVLLGLFHGLLFLPVLLSWVGPASFMTSHDREAYKPPAADV